MLQAVRGGSGPEHAVRAYLLTTVRRVAANWTKTAKREQLVDDFAVFAAQAARGSEVSDDDTLDLGADVRAMHEAEQSMAMQAFRSLPERWQAVLWHTEVEDESPSEVATLFGLDANGTRVLASRAREGLKQAYLQAHVSATLTMDEECARYADRLGAYARGGLRTRAERGLRKHLEECAKCRLAAGQIKEVASGIPALVPIAVIGWFGAAGYAKVAALIAGGAGAGAAGAAGAASAAGGSSGGASAGGGAAASEGLGAPVKAGIAAGVVAVAAAAVALALAGNDSPAQEARGQAGHLARRRGTALPSPDAAEEGARAEAAGGRRPRRRPTPTPDSDAQAHPEAHAQAVAHPDEAEAHAQADPYAHPDPHSDAAASARAGRLPVERAGLRRQRRRHQARDAARREQLGVAALRGVDRGQAVRARGDRPRPVLRHHRPQPQLLGVRRGGRRRRHDTGPRPGALLRVRGRLRACGSRRWSRAATRRSPSM